MGADGFDFQNVDEANEALISLNHGHDFILDSYHPHLIIVCEICNCKFEWINSFQNSFEWKMENLEEKLILNCDEYKMKEALE